MNVIYISGPGHGGPAIVAQVYMEGVYTDYYPEITQDEAGLGKFFKQFNFPGGIPSHVAPETPGSMHEGGELGYSISHAYGAVLDKPELLVAVCVGDGEAETGPLATSWHANKFLNPATDGAVLPILHLNGYKIANPAILARIPEDELKSLFWGYGYEPLIVSGSEPGLLHPAFSAALRTCADKIAAIQTEARRAVGLGQRPRRPRWPMIILRTPKGWTGPKIVDGKMIEDSHRSHQVPVSAPGQHQEHLKILEAWLRSYEPEKCFDENGSLIPELRALIPSKGLRMGENSYTNPVVKPLVLPDFASPKYAVEVNPDARGEIQASDTYAMGTYLRDIIAQNASSRNFRIFGPDETSSNRLHAVYEQTSKQWMGEYFDKDENMAPDGRILEMLSEHQCEGWLEGYLLTGGHGLLSSYEAFIHM